MAILSQSSENTMSFLLSYVFSSTSENKRAEQVLGRGRDGPNNVYTLVNVKMINFKKT
jgi:hypothetical protein